MEQVAAVASAISQWTSGPLPHDSLLFGHSIYFWARVGKAIQLLAAFTIISDIVGADRLRGLSKWLLRPFKLIGSEEKRTEILVTIFLLLSTVFAVNSTIHHFIEGYALLDSISLALPEAAFSALAWVMAIYLGGAAAAFVVLWTALLLRHPNAGNWFKVTGLGLLLAGVTLDMLGS